MYIVRVPRSFSWAHIDRHVQRLTLRGKQNWLMSGAALLHLCMVFCFLDCLLYVQPDDDWIVAAAELELNEPLIALCVSLDQHNNAGRITILLSFENYKLIINDTLCMVSPYKLAIISCQHTHTHSHTRTV